MNVNPYQYIGLLILLAAVPTTSYGENALKKYKTSKSVRKFNKAVGFAPKIKENDISKLLNIIWFEGDLMKLSAHQKLVDMYKKSNSKIERQQLLMALIQSSTELIKYYSNALNCPKTKYIFTKGLVYAHKCIYKATDKGPCYKYKTLLLEAYYFSFKANISKLMKFWLRHYYKKAIKKLPDDRKLKFLDTKLKCEVRLMVENKSNYVRKIMELYIGDTKKERNFDCITELLFFEHQIYSVGSFDGEYYYLLARAYKKQHNNVKAIEYLKRAIKGPAIDLKSVNVNKKAQNLLEKLQLQENI